MRFHILFSFVTLGAFCCAGIAQAQVDSGDVSSAVGGEFNISAGLIASDNTVDSSGTLVIAGPRFDSTPPSGVESGTLISGSINTFTGSITTNSGALTILTSNTTSGSVTLAGNNNSGTLKLGSSGTLVLNSSQTTNLAIGNTTLLQTGSFTDGGTNLNFGTSATFANPNTFNLANGTVTVSGSTYNGGTLVLLGTSTPIGSGTINVNGSITFGESNFPLPNGSVILKGGTLTIGSNSHVGLTINQPLLAGSYHITDLGDLDSWLGSETGATASLVSSDLALFGGHVNFNLHDFFSVTSDKSAELEGHLDTSGSGWDLTREYGIDLSGNIAVGATAADGTSHALLLSPVPEPATIVLACCGLAALVFARRRMA
jgi:hypothetical protein